jgi:hypothetical protein
VLFPYREAVEVAAPAVPGGDQRADDAALQLGDQEGAGTVGQQALEHLWSVGGSRMDAAGRRPQLEHAPDVGFPSLPHDGLIA